MSFGTRFKVASGAMLARQTVPSGIPDQREAIWHQWYDTQAYTSTATTRLLFFTTAPGADRTLTNIQTAGQLPEPYYFSMYDICMDYLVQNTVAAAASVVGAYNNLALLMLVGRPTWQLTIQDKNYGPYSVTALHGTGGPVGGIDAGTAVEIHQWATNALNPGWNYFGTLIIPPKISFSFELVWSAAQTLTLSPNLRLSMFGILSRTAR